MSTKFNSVQVGQQQARYGDGTPIGIGYRATTKELSSMGAELGKRLDTITGVLTDILDYSPEDFATLREKHREDIQSISQTPLLAA